jgi:Na+-translocating ferredoxin:NAD+ oxidoreductase RnfG subunit
MSENKKISESEKDQLIDAQKQVIGILFEVIKRLQTNNDLDEEYFEIIQKDDKNNKRIQDIINEREENSKIVGRLLEQLEI